MLDDEIPAFGSEGVGADQKAVGEFEKSLAPGRVSLATGRMVIAEGEIGMCLPLDQGYPGHDVVDAVVRRRD